MKDTEVKVKEGGGCSQGRGWGGEEAGELGWVGFLQETWQLPLEEDEHLSGLCVLCVTWRSCGQASKLTRLFGCHLGRGEDGGGRVELTPGTRLPQVSGLAVTRSRFPSPVSNFE